MTSPILFRSLLKGTRYVYRYLHSRAASGELLKHIHAATLRYAEYKGNMKNYFVYYQYGLYEELMLLLCTVQQ